MNDAYSRWSTGNRGRATSASEVVEVAGLNHAIGVWFGAGGQGVTLKLAWGPSNPSPWNLRFVFVVFLIFPSLSSFYVFFFSFYFWAVVFLSHSDIFRSWFWYVSVAFFLFFLFEISFSLFSNFHTWFILVESDSWMAIFLRVVWTIAVSAKKFLSTTPFFYFIIERELEFWKVG